MYVLTKYPLKQIAEICGVTPQAVFLWRRDQRVPAKHVPLLARKLGLRPAQLRPDLYNAKWRM